MRRHWRASDSPMIRGFGGCAGQPRRLLSEQWQYGCGHSTARGAQLTNADELWRLLVTISARKLTAERRRQMADKRGGGMVRGKSIFAQRDQLDWNTGMAQIMDENQMPENAEMILKTCEDLLQLLPDAKSRETAILRMEGYNHQEIADRLGCSLIRTKQRVARIKEIWDRNGTT